MNSRAALVAGLFASVMATVSCTDGPNKTPVAPTGPSSLSGLLQPRLGGNWGGDLTLIEVAGGNGAARVAGLAGCAGASMDKVMGEKNYNTLLLTQSDSDLTGTLVSAGTGLSCEYKGRIGANNTFVLEAQECMEKELHLMCTDGSSVTLDLVGSSLTAQFDDPVNPKSISGTAAHTYNVFTQDHAPLNAVVARHSFQSMTRR
jgi:hypothetical protein